MTDSEASVSTPPSQVADLLTLAKVRLNALVVATTASGYYMAGTGETDFVRLAVTCGGTALVASGASALNQVAERATDALMERTRRRPVADARMTPMKGRLTGWVLAAVGLAIIALGSNGLAVIVAAATLLSYLWLYTPLKRYSSLSTVVGAVPGALPPLIGWAAARGSVDELAGWSLFLIMFIWQLPHFLAIAWIYREDYGRAGLPMLSVIDRTGAMAGRQAMLWAATLVPFSLLPVALGLADRTYGLAVLVLGLMQFALAVRFALVRSRPNARALFFGSITYLPLLWIVMCVGRIAR